MAYVKFNKNQNYRDQATGEIFSAKRITDASFTHWSKKSGSKKLKNAWIRFRKAYSIENYVNGKVGFINPNSKKLATFVATCEAAPAANQSKTKNSNSNGMKIKNFEMGPVRGSQFKLTIMGTVAVAVDGGYSSYDKESGEITDVTGFTMDMGDGMFYKMPAQKAQVGDLIAYKNTYGYVTKVGKNKTTLLLLDGEEKKITPTKSPFGFSFVTKIVSAMDMGGEGNGLFGDMNPMMMMMMNNGNGNMFGGDNSMMNLFMMSQMTGNNFGDLFGGKSKKKKK